MARPGISKHVTFDTLLELHDGAAAVTADDLAEVSGAEQIINLYQGAASGSAGVGAEFNGLWVIDVSAIDQTTGDELYTLILEGCNTAAFTTTSIVQLAMIQLGDEDTMQGNCDLDLGVGRYVVPFSNELVGTTYQYCRLAFDVGGTSPSITCTSFLGKGRAA